MHIAIPMPPPIHKVAKPFVTFLFCISWINVTNILAPEAPIGWPSAIAPPFTFKLLVSQPNSLLTAIDWAANASFDSINSNSFISQPAF